MTEGLRLQICGRLAIEHRGGTLGESRFPGRQGRRLWAYLVLNRRRALPRDELAEAIWGDETPDAWPDDLNVLVSRLRSALRGVAAADVAIRGEPGRYTLDVPAESFVDFERCWRALLRGEAALRQGDVATTLMEALVARSIASRGFLVGEVGDWIEGQRRVLADTEVQAIEIAAEAELRGGKAMAAHRLGRELVGVDPLRESGYRLLMRALAASGNRALAIRIMDECRAVLREQVGVGPSAETERVFREAVGLAPEHH